MTQIALEAQRYAPPDPLLPAAARVPSAFCTALDTVSTHEARWHKQTRLTITKGATRGDILGDRGVAEKDEGLIDALMQLFFNHIWGDGVIMPRNCTECINVETNVTQTVFP